MAPRYTRNPDFYPRAREEWDEREVVPPRTRFGEPPRQGGRDMYDHPDYAWSRGGADEAWRDLPPAAWAGMAGWFPPYHYPLHRPGYGDFGMSRGAGPDEGWHGHDERPGRGYRYGGPPGGRNFFDKATDEVSSWFGDDEAERRREEDHRGRGPRNYVRSDTRIEEDVNDRLTDDRLVDASDVSVKVQEREVTLDGHVTSRRAKRRAEDCADSVSGVVHVQNNLRVRQMGQDTGNV